MLVSSSKRFGDTVSEFSESPNLRQSFFEREQILRGLSLPPHLDKLVFNETTALLPFHRYRSSHFITTALNAVVGAQLKEPGVLVEFSSSSRRLIVSSSRESLVNSVEFFRAKERTAGEGEGEKKARPVTSFVDDGKTNRLFEGEPLQKLSFQPGFHSRGGFKARLSLNRA